METITSRDNAKIKYACAVRDTEKQRAADGVFFAEGPKLCLELAKSCTPRVVYATAAALAKTPELARFDPAEIAPHVAEKLSGTKSNQGVFALFETPVPPADILNTARRILALEGVQDPGNVGTVIRTANALGVDAVILAGDCADPTSPRCVRATMGAAFRQSIVEADLPGLARLLGGWDLPLYGAALAEGALDIRSAELSRAAVAIGNEGHGLSPELLGLCTGRVIIPMAPGSESLNAAVAAAIVMWELSGRRL